MITGRMFAIFFAGLSFVGCAGSVALVAPPTGNPFGDWERPKDTDLAGPNWQFRKDRPDRSLTAIGDFNGDGVTDRAELQILRAEQKFALIAFVSGVRDGFVLQQGKLSALPQFGISVQPPGRVKTLCGKGYNADDPKCEKGVAFIDLANPAINLFVFESASGMFYWKDGKFEQEWTAD